MPPSEVYSLALVVSVALKTSILVVLLKSIHTWSDGSSRLTEELLPQLVGVLLCARAEKARQLIKANAARPARRCQALTAVLRSRLDAGT